MTFYPDRVMRFIELTISGDQTISTTAPSVIDFDAIHGTAGHGVSLPNTGTIRLKGGREYTLQAQCAMSISSAGALTFKWYDVSGSANILAADGAGDGVHTATYSVNQQDQSDSTMGVLAVAPASDFDVQYRVEGKTGTVRAASSRIIIMEAA